MLPLLHILILKVKMKIKSFEMRVKSLNIEMIFSFKCSLQKTYLKAPRTIIKKVRGDLLKWR